ncbi:GNAT family N-acetyltransferase [Plantactinospora sp. CA-290183]|uniref:GNAT family N-acetyltransferase n=1 Tax=Plantactinospora sp. CA-290183 TaxID=3240006 RepID=UPI003D92A7F8
MADLLIRAARFSDIDHCARLAGSKDRAEVRLQAVERGEESMLVAVLAGNVVGVESIRWRDGCDPPHPWLYGLSVGASARGRGIGRALVEAAEAMCVSSGAESISLDVDVDDARALGFYAHLGYLVIRGHVHRWRSIDPRTRAVVATGHASTWIMRRGLRLPPGRS